MKTICTALLLTSLALPMESYAEKPQGAVYLDGGDSQYALILAHGKDKHPTWLVVDPVRKGIHKALDYHTLSLQMPTGYDDWKDYADGFPQAYSTIDQAVDYLKTEKGVTHIYLFGHSMGSRMASAYVSQNPDHGLDGLIVAGCRNNGDRPLNCEDNLTNVSLPVLDIWGSKNGKDSQAASEREHLISDTYTQQAITGANHKFEGHEDALVEVVADWLRKQN